MSSGTSKVSIEADHVIGNIASIHADGRLTSVSQKEDALKRLCSQTQKPMRTQLNFTVSSNLINTFSREQPTCSPQLLEPCISQAQSMVMPHLTAFISL